jgi:hypothetical protein
MKQAKGEGPTNPPPQGPGTGPADAT